jgi:hypothetical protein
VPREGYPIKFLRAGLVGTFKKDSGEKILLSMGIPTGLSNPWA